MYKIIRARLSLRIKRGMENVRVNVREIFEKCRQFTRCCHTKYYTLICPANA